MRKQNWYNPYHALANKKKKVNSHTPGSTKGGTCVTTPQLRSICRRNRSYKRQDYVMLSARIKMAKV